MNSRVSASFTSFLLLFLVAALAPGQGGETRPSGLPPADKRAVPATPSEGRRLAAQIDADRAALEEEQRENPSPGRARTIQILEDEIETIKLIEARRQERAAEATKLDRATTGVEELRKRLAQAGQDEEPLPDPADPKAEATLARERETTDDLIKEEMKRRDDAVSSREKLELERERVLRQLPARKRDLSESLADLKDYETDSREAAAGGIGAEQGRLMGEQVYLYRLRAAGHQTLVDTLRLQAGDVGDALIDQASAEVALADENLHRLHGRRSKIDALAEMACESCLDRGRAEEARIAKVAAEVAPWARPYWQLKLKLAGVDVEIAEIARKKRGLETRSGPAGEVASLQADAAAETRSFAKVDAGKAEIEDVVPGTTSGLLEYIARREKELVRVEALQDEVRALRKDSRAYQRAARADDAAALVEQIDAARKATVAPEGAEAGSAPEREAASASSWEKLRGSLKAALASRAALLDDYDQLLAKTAETLLETRKTRETSLLRYRSALLWTRDPTEISLESVDRARADLGLVPEAVASAAGAAARGSWDWFGAAARESRYLDLAKVVGSLLALAALLVLLHPRAAKVYGTGVEATAMLAFAGVALPAIAGASRQTIAVSSAVFAPPFAFLLGRTLIDLVFGRGAGERGLLGAPEGLSRVLSKTCVLLLRICACFVPLAILLSVTGYRERNPGIVELLWLVNAIGCYVVVLGVLLRPSGIATVLRRKGGASDRASLMPAIFAAAYPAVIAAVLFLLVLRSLSYRVAVRYFLEHFLISAAWLTGAILLRRWFARILFGHDQVVARPHPEATADAQKYEADGRRALYDRLRRVALTLAVFGPAVFFVLDAWGLTGAGWDAVFNKPLRPISETLTLGNVLSAVLTAVLAFFVVRSTRDLLRFVILPRTTLDTGVRYTIVTLTTYVLVAASAIVILGGQLKVAPEVIGGFVAAMGLGLGFGLQEIINNFFSGIILLVERPLKVGDTVSIAGTTGRVDRINMRSTTIMTAENTGVIVPNKDLISSTVTNWSAGTPMIRESIALGIAYGSDTALFKTVVTEAAGSHGLVLKHPAPDLVFTGFGSSSMDFALRYWIKLGSPGSKVKSDLFFALEAAFRRHGIEMPYPQQDVHVRSWDGKAPPARPAGFEAAAAGSED